MMTGLALLIAIPAAAQDTFFYPGQGQSSERQNKDKGECHVWAVQQSGFNPTKPPAPAATQLAPAPQGGALRGVARGGAVGGAIAGDAGKGAAAGAGALGGPMRRVDQQRQQVVGQQQYDAQLNQQHDTYNRALATCMRGRGYSAG